MDFFKITIPSKNVYIKLLRHALKNFLYLCNFKNDEEIFMMELALNESVANVIEHTYSYNEKKLIDIEFLFDGKELIIKIRDYGEKIDTSKIKHRPLEEYRDGGLGVYIIEQVFGKPVWEDIEIGNLMILKKDIF